MIASTALWIVIRGVKIPNLETDGRDYCKSPFYTIHIMAVIFKQSKFIPMFNHFWRHLLHLHFHRWELSVTVLFFGGGGYMIKVLVGMIKLNPSIFIHLLFGLGFTRTDSNSMEVTLYSYFRSTCSWRVRIGKLFVINIPYETVCAFVILIPLLVSW